MTGRHYAVAGWLLSDRPDGAGRRLRTLLRALPPLLAADERLTMLLGSGTPAPPATAGIACERLPIPAGPTWRRAVAERRVLPAALRDLGADLLHLESLPAPPRLGCPLVLTIHDLRDLGRFRRRPRWLARAVLRRGVAAAAAVIVPSRHVAAELAAAVPGTAATVLPAAVDLVADPAPSGRHRHFLHVGHLEPRKDVELLLRAHAAAGRRSLLPPLVLAGRDAGSGRRLRKLAAALAVDVEFRGEVADVELHRLYADACAVLVPSRYEGFGLAAAEAIAHRRPVLVSDAGALPEVVGDAGRVLPAGDVAAWADALAAAAVVPLPPPDPGRLTAPASAAATLLGVWRRISAPSSSPGSR